MGWNGKNETFVELWNLAEAKPIAHFGTADVSAVAWHPQSVLILWADGPTLHLWNRETGLEVAKFIGHKASIGVIAVSPDGKWAASGSDDGDVRLWAIPGGAVPAAGKR